MSIWRERRQRAVVLMARQPHAEELLAFYIAVLEAQDPVWRWARSALAEAPPSASPRRAVEALDAPALQSRFLDFTASLVAVAPTSLGTAGRMLLEEPAVGLAESLAAALDPWGGAPRPPAAEERARSGDTRDHEDRPRKGIDRAAVCFFGSAFLEPIAVEGRSRRREGPGGASADPGAPGSPAAVRRDAGAQCAYCGRVPLLATLSDDQDSRGRRTAICGFCANQWPELRTACLACGEADSARLLHHVSDSLPHMRVEECRSCGTYHKTVDRRIDGQAVPVVDELASVELDLWAQERKLEKLHPNLLGL